MVLDKPRTLPPSLREKERYIVFEVISETPIVFEDLSESVWFTMLDFLGEVGTSACDYWLIRNLFDPKTQKGIIKCSHEKVMEIKASLTMVQRVGETRSIIKVLGVTGTIKSAKRKYLGFTDLTQFGKKT